MQEKETNKFKVLTEQFADIKILRYQVPDFENLPLKHKKLLYFLYEAALSGRDIIYDQNYKYNLLIRRTLENIVKTFRGNRKTKDWENFMVYVKRVWFSNGIHHHYSMDKFIPEISREYFRMLMHDSDPSGFSDAHGNVDGLLTWLEPLIFDNDIDKKRVVLDEGVDMVKASANHFYDGVSQDEAEEFYRKKNMPEDPRPVSWGLNSQLSKDRNHGTIRERVWKWGGMYGEAIEKIVFWLEEALKVAATEAQQKAFEALIDYYKTGDLKKFDEYNIRWLSDTDSPIDVINGFIEVYGDPLGRKGTYESVVYMRDEEATRRAATISDNAQWFEDHSPTDKQYKKENVTGVTARGINVVAESGDCSPATPIGINLPNSEWIRTEHGSKSVTIKNIMEAYHEASKESGAIEEFAWSDEEVALSKKWGNLASNLHVDLHEIVGHGSGKIRPGVGNPSDILKNYASTIEEARADLFALYYAIDEKLIDLGLMPGAEVGKAEYNDYIRGGLLTQLVRVEPGKNLEESHMRNRQLIAAWAYEKGLDDKVIEKKQRDGKTYFVVNDHLKLRRIFGELLREVQRIKSEGDFQAARNLVENYGVKVDQDIHREVLERWKKLKIAPFAGFINPRLIPVYNADGELRDVKIEYPDNFAMQMLEYADKYSFLPDSN